MDASDSKPYFMAVGGGELERLQLQHEVFRLSMNGLLFAPISFSKGRVSVLDSGTADGAWLRDLYQCLLRPEQHEFVGTDIETDWFPRDTPENMTFAKQSITEAWPLEYEGKFDFVHQRLVLGCVGACSPGKSVSELVKTVKPGGWIELLESDLEDKLNNGPAMCRWMDLTNEVFCATGAPRFFFKNLETWLRKYGVRDIETRFIDLKYGATNQHTDMVEISVKSLLLAAHAIVSAAKSMRLQTTIQYDDLLSSLENELREKGAVFRQRVVWGRKAT